MTLSWSRQSWKLELISTLVIGGAIATLGNCAFAQPKSDNTLGSERSIVTPDVIINGLPSDRIDGGAKRGANLFHSFGEFNVDAGRGVYFTNPPGIENIISRVTGSNPSQILGTLGVTGGNANLFLINPDGIVFGPNARLDVGGSFVATTANAIQFSNQGFFNASTPNVPPLLTVNPSALIFNQVSAGSITNNSIAPLGSLGEDISGIPTLFGLRVPDGQSLLLVGGNVKLDGGGLKASGGQVEIGGLAGAGTVGLNVTGNTLDLSFPVGVQRADISLLNGARVDASGEGGGTVQIEGKQVTLTDGSQIATVTQGKPGGALTVNASDFIELSGVPNDGENLETQTVGDGRAGDIKLDTQRLVVKNGAGISTTTLGDGAGGQLSVTAPMSVELSGTLVVVNPDKTTSTVNSGLFSLAIGSGNAGSITVNTKRLVIQDRAAISANSTSIEDNSGNTTVGTGRGGNVTVIAPESVELKNGVLETDTLGSGDAGEIKIATGNLLLRQGSQISTNASITTGGNITIKTGVLTILEDSKISANSQESLGGKVKINAQGIFRSPESNITASSALGSQFSGTVQINTFVNNPSQGLVNLPVKPVDVIGQIAQGCGTGNRTIPGRFVVTGRGGLPPNPSDTLSSDAILDDMRLPTTTVRKKRSTTVATTQTSNYNTTPIIPATGAVFNGNDERSTTVATTQTSNYNTTPIIPATGAVFNGNDEVTLIAAAPTATLEIPWLSPTACRADAS